MFPVEVWMIIFGINRRHYLKQRVLRSRLALESKCFGNRFCYHFLDGYLPWTVPSVTSRGVLYYKGAFRKRCEIVGMRWNRYRNKLIELYIFLHSILHLSEVLNPCCLLSPSTLMLCLVVSHLMNCLALLFSLTSFSGLVLARLLRL